MLKKTSATLSWVFVWGACPALASEPPAPAAVLPAITNSATRTDRLADAVPATITVQTATDIESAGARDIKDLFRNQVDLTVRAAPGRFGLAQGATGRAGNEGINIRGLEGNQVLMLVDGIRVPSSFSFSAFATGRADYLALEATQAVEVLRGPASSAFGSDGLAGALSLRTLSPADLLRPDQRSAGFVRVGATQVDASAVLTAAAAWQGGPWQALLLASRRQGHETTNQGRNEADNSTRTAPNPLDYRQQVLLGKLNFSPEPAHRLGATLEAVQRRLQTDVASARAVVPVAPAVLAATAVLRLDARDRVQRHRLSLEHAYDDLNGRAFQKAQSRLYAQESDTQQVAAEDRHTAADRTRRNVYRERLLGLSTQFETTLGGAWPQRLSYGVDASRNQITALRDGTPNPSAPAPFGEAFPVKPFPDTRHTLAGAFVLSELELGRVSLLPGLRYDHFRLAPAAVGYSGASAAGVVALSGQALTPRVGMVWRLSEAWAPYAQWSQGFRAPSPDQVNNGFTNVASGYRSVGNPNLKAEEADSVEAGVRSRGAGWQWQWAAFDNRYRNFISQEAVSGSFTPADPTVFQFINLARARIRGVELRAEWRLAAAWSATLATALTRGSSTRNGVTAPLDSVEPARTALGLRYTAPALTLHADVLHAQGKARGRISAAGSVPSSPGAPASPAFAPPSYTVLDLGARWQAAPGWAVTAQVNNVTDATYWRWSDVRGVATTSPVLDAYTAPGRHLQLALRHDF